MLPANVIAPCGINPGTREVKTVVSRAPKPSGPTPEVGSDANGSDAPKGGFDDVVLAHAGVVYRFAVRLAGDANAAEDLVQETFLRAHKAYDRFELREYGAKPWLLKILHHVFFTQRKRAPREPTLLEDIDFEDCAAELERNPLPQLVAGQVDWEDFDDELKAAMQRLPTEYRSVMMLWALGDLSYKEIGGVVGCPIGTVMSRLFRARQMLGEALADYAAQRGIRTQE